MAFTFAHSSAKVNKTPFCLGKMLSLGGRLRKLGGDSNLCCANNQKHGVYSFITLSPTGQKKHFSRLLRKEGVRISVRT